MPSSTGGGQSTPPPTGGASSGSASVATGPSARSVDPDSKEAIAVEQKESFDQYWTSYAKRLRDSHIKLLVEAPTESSMAAALKDQSLSQVRGVPGVDYVGILFTTGLSSEAITEPHIRGAPFRRDRLIKVGSAIRKSRAHLFTDDESSAGKLGKGDLFIALDGMKPGAAPNTPSAQFPPSCQYVHWRSVIRGPLLIALPPLAR